MHKITKALRCFGITNHYKGFYQVSYSVQLVAENESRLASVIESIYMATAKHYECSWKAVERNIRTVVARAWAINPELMIEIAEYPLRSAPTNTEFIEMLAHYVRNNK